MDSIARLSPSRAAFSGETTNTSGTSSSTPGKGRFRQRRGPRTHSRPARSGLRLRSAHRVVVRPPRAPPGRGVGTTHARRGLPARSLPGSAVLPARSAWKAASAPRRQSVFGARSQIHQHRQARNTRLTGLSILSFSFAFAFVVVVVCSRTLLPSSNPYLLCLHSVRAEGETSNYLDLNQSRAVARAHDSNAIGSPQLCATGISPWRGCGRSALSCRGRAASTK